MAPKKKHNDPATFTLGKTKIARGHRAKVNLSVARLYDFTEMKIPVEVVRGHEAGPVLFICAAIHGDEINGVEIIRRLLRLTVPSDICGTLIAVPIVNVFGFNERSRYLPDRRDLNRCFPGSERGSMGAQMADLIMEEIVAKSSHGIDLHTGAFHRSNLAQIRANLNDPETQRLAEAFGAPVMINASLRDGSLRQAVAEQKMPMLLYEGGEALRFDEQVIQGGVDGILSVMHCIGMHISPAKKRKLPKPYYATATHWVRAPQSGIFLARAELGQVVKKGEVLGHISDPFGDHLMAVKATQGGKIIGNTKLPLANEGDALYHIAYGTGTGISTDFPENFDPVNAPVTVPS